MDKLLFFVNASLDLSQDWNISDFAKSNSAITNII